MEIDGTIGPATAEYVARGINRTANQNAECLIIQLDTPGGLLESTRKIVQHFYASQKPVVIYVAPAGAGAISAGCFITLASDVAAMAPNTSIGAAHPVSIGGGGSLTTTVEQAKAEIGFGVERFFENIDTDVSESVSPVFHGFVDRGPTALLL